MAHDPEWLRWARRLQAIAQTGLHFSDVEYDRDRYRQISAIAAEIIEHHSDADLATINHFFKADDGYATPKVDVRAGIVRDGHILLVRERLDGLWTLPGGWADVNDTPSEAVEREAVEETGFSVRATKLAMLHDKTLHNPQPSAHHTYKLFFLCEITGGEARTSFETTAVEFFDPDRLPDLSLPRVTPAQIARLLDHAADPSLPTDFD